MSISLALSQTPAYTVTRILVSRGVPGYFPAFAGTHPWRDGQAELTWVAD